MASIIDGIIPAQQYETIRDKIGLILYEELVNQFTLTTDEDLNVKVFVERFVAFDKTDFPCLNVVFSGGNYDNKNTTTVDGEYSFFIDAYCAAKTTTTESGDSKASFKLQRLLGVCRAILENPQYRNLKLDICKTGSVGVKSIAISQPENKQDATSTIMGRLTFNVRALEDTLLLDALPIDNWKTQVKLNLTEKGYLYEKI